MQLCFKVLFYLDEVFRFEKQPLIFSLVHTDCVLKNVR